MLIYKSTARAADWPIGAGGGDHECGRGCGSVHASNQVHVRALSPLHPFNPLKPLNPPNSKPQTLHPTPPGSVPRDQRQVTSQSIGMPLSLSLEGLVN